MSGNEAIFVDDRLPVLTGSKEPLGLNQNESGDQRYPGLDALHRFNLLPSENMRMANSVFRNIDFEGKEIKSSRKRVLFIRDIPERSRAKLGRVVTFSGLHNPAKSGEISERDAAIVDQFDRSSTDAPVVYATEVKTNHAGQAFSVNIVAWGSDSKGRFVGGPFHTETRRFAVQGVEGDDSGFKEIVFGEGLKSPSQNSVDWSSIHITRCAENSTIEGQRIVAKLDQSSKKWIKISEEIFGHSSLNRKVDKKAVETNPPSDALRADDNMVG